MNTHWPGRRKAWWASRGYNKRSGPDLSVRAALVPSGLIRVSAGVSLACRWNGVSIALDHSQQGTSRYTVLGTQRVTVVATCFGTIRTTSTVLVKWTGRVVHTGTCLVQVSFTMVQTL